MSIALEMKVMELERLAAEHKERITALESQVAALLTDLGGPPAKKQPEKRPNGSRP